MRVFTFFFFSFHSERIAFDPLVLLNQRENEKHKYYNCSGFKRFDPVRLSLNLYTMIICIFTHVFNVSCGEVTYRFRMKM